MNSQGQEYQPLPCLDHRSYDARILSKYSFVKAFNSGCVATHAASSFTPTTTFSATSLGGIRLLSLLFTSSSYEPPCSSRRPFSCLIICVQVPAAITLASQTLSWPGLGRILS